MHLIFCIPISSSFFARLVIFQNRSLMCHSKSVASHDAMFGSAVDFDDQFCNCSRMAEPKSSSGLLDGFAFFESSSMHHVFSPTVLYRLNRRRSGHHDHHKCGLCAFVLVVELVYHQRSRADGVDSLMQLLLLPLELQRQGFPSRATGTRSCLQHRSEEFCVRVHCSYVYALSVRSFSL